MKPSRVLVPPDVEKLVMTRFEEIWRALEEQPDDVKRRLLREMNLFTLVLTWEKEERTRRSMAMALWRLEA